MRKVLVATTVFTLAGIGLGAGPAGAAARSVDEEAFCEALTNVEDFSPESSFDPDSLESITDPMREASKFAPKKVKKAMRRLANFYDDLADGDTQETVEVFQNQRFLRASITYSSYYAETCAGIDIPETDT